MVYDHLRLACPVASFALLLGRHGEREPVVTIPPVDRPVVVRAEPATTAATVRAQQDRNAVGDIDWLVHGNDTPQTHLLDLLVREVLTEEASELGVWLRELALVGLCTDLLRDPVVVREDHALENGNVCRDAIGRLEVRGTEHLRGAAFNAETVALQTLDPALASRAVGWRGHESPMISTIKNINS